MQIDVSARYRLHPVPLSFLSSPFAFPAHDAQFSLIQGQQSIAKPRSFGLFVIQPTTKHISYWFASSRHSCLCISPIQDKPLSLCLSPVPLIHQPDSRYETDKRCFPLFSLSSQIIYVRLRDRRLNDHEGTALSKKSFRVIAEQSSF